MYLKFSENFSAVLSESCGLLLSALGPSGSDRLSTEQLGPVECAKRLNPPPAAKWRKNGVSDCRIECAQAQVVEYFWSYFRCLVFWA